MRVHAIRCRDTGEPLANKLDGGTCVCKPGECELRKLRNREGDYAKNNSEDEGFDAMGFAIGLATGFPISPRGITGASIIGAILHPTERHAAYDVTSAVPTPSDDAPFNDNRTIGTDRSGLTPDLPPSAPAESGYSPPTRDPDPPPQSAPTESGYSPPSYTPPAADSQPSYSTPDPQPSYSTPSYDPSPSYDSGGGGGSSFGSDS